MTAQEKLRSGLRWKILRFVWVKAGNISRWSNQKMLSLTIKADKIDCENGATIGFFSKKEPT
jgi:hypothetical protein